MLRSIGLSDNQVSGQIPTSLFNCKHLEEMYFADNQLEGSLPMEIGNLTSLRIMNLENNSLEGKLKGWFCVGVHLLDINLYVCINYLLTFQV